MGRASFYHQLIAGFFNDMHIKLCDQRRYNTITASSKNPIRQSTNQEPSNWTSPFTRHFCLSHQVSVGKNVLKGPKPRPIEAEETTK